MPSILISCRAGVYFFTFCLSVTIQHHHIYCVIGLFTYRVYNSAVFVRCHLRPIPCICGDAKKLQFDGFRCFLGITLNSYVCPLIMNLTMTPSVIFSEILGGWISSAGTKGFAGHFKPHWGLLSFVFVDYYAAHNVLDNLCFEAKLNDLGN